MPVIQMKLKEAVAAGKKILTEREPNWRKRINRKTLNLGDWNLCILGQVFGGYGTGLEVLFGPNKMFDETELSIKHGFTAFHQRGYTTEDLQKEWERVLSE